MVAALAPVGRAEVRLSEFMADSNDRLLAKDELGRLRPGSGAHWIDPGFMTAGWRRGAAPLGFGGPSGLGTNVMSLLRNRTPSLYLRRSFTATAAEAANLGRLRLRITFDDGFVAYLNGREAGRANAGPPGHFLPHDQPAYNFAAAVTDDRFEPRAQPGVGGPQPLTIDLGPATSWLHAGENVLAIHLVNREPDTAARVDATLDIVQATAVVDLLRDDFDDANGASRVHTRTSGVATTTLLGTPPPGSWLAEAPPPESGPAGPDLTLTTRLDPTAGWAATGALRVVHEQAGPGAAATWYGPPATVPAIVAAAGLTPAHLAAMTLSFRFRASPDTAATLRLEPSTGDLAHSLSGLPPLSESSGTAAAESPTDTFTDAVGGTRSLTVNALGGVSGGITGTLRNSFTLSVGPAMRDFAFKVVEDQAPGAGATTGHLRCDVTRAAAAPDSFGFTLQTFQVRSWTPGVITPEELAAAVLQVDARLAAGVALRVWLEPATATSGAAQRLDLGTLTGTGAWQRHDFDPAAGTNQTAFLAALNAQNSTLVRVAFRSEAPLPVGTAWQIDTIGFVPWRTYTTTLATGTNTQAFLDAVNAQAAPQFFPAWDMTGAALTPEQAALVIDTFALTTTVLNAGTSRTLVPWAASEWDYWPGLAEPCGGMVEAADFNTPAAEPGFADWIELENTGPQPVSLAGWSLSTRHEDPRQWMFPATASLAPGGRLVVLADERETPPSGAAWLHASFTLPAEGGYLALVDPAGIVRDGFEPGYLPQGPFHSYGRGPAGLWGFLRVASPGSPNTGPWAAAKTEPVLCSPPGGFHTGPVTLTLTTPTPGARIRYTLDGTEPSPTTGFAYTDPIVLAPLNNKTGHAVRARAFQDGQVPSAVTTQTYLIDQHPGLRSAPALALTEDPGTTFYHPSGIMAVQGGTYVDELWVAQQASDYHMPMGHGRLLDSQAPQRPYERPVHFEFLPADGRAPVSVPAGLRIASSPYSRPRLTLTEAATASPLPADPTEKPSFNLFFRSDYGPSSVTHPFIPETPVRRFEELRLRAGKNDIRNPFIRDEFVRRLFTDMGQTGSVGSFNGLWINGVYKGYFNLCERIREPFLQNHHPGSGEWDVNYIFQFEDGDSGHFDNFLYQRLAANLTPRTNYEALAAVLDLSNAADYYLLMVFAAMWDWPDNNWAMARERAPNALWRCYAWDAEGSFGLNGYKSATWNSFSQDLLQNNFWMCFQFQRLMSSPDWRLLFADRIQKHFFNGGALTDARLTARKDGTAAEIQPFLTHAGVTPDHTWFTNWLSPANGRKRTLFPRLLPGQAGYAAGHFRDPNGDGSLTDTLWPLTLPPTLSLAPGSVPAGSTLSLSLAPGVPAGSTIYFTLNGGDPRAPGGATAGAAQVYSVPLPLAASAVTVRARVRHATTGEWSPLTEAAYRIGTVPAGPENLVVSELMYHPPSLTASEIAAGFTDSEEFEYLALRAIGPSPVDIAALRFSEGVGFDSANATRTVIDPGEQVLLVRNREAMTQRYGPAVASRIIGEFFGGLSNSGEALRLERKSDGVAIKAFRYGDQAPWPAAADGAGPSLLLRDPPANPDHGAASNWTASAALAGQPGGTTLALSYAEWGAWTFPAAAWADPSLSSPDADADGDGWANHLEFVLMGAPADSSRLPDVHWSWTTGPEGPRLEVSVVVRPGTTHLDLAPEAASALTASLWQRDFVAEPDAPQPDGSLRRTWRRMLPASPASVYGRLRVAPVGP